MPIQDAEYVHMPIQDAEYVHMPIQDADDVICAYAYTGC